MTNWNNITEENLELITSSNLKKTQRLITAKAISTMLEWTLE